MRIKLLDGHDCIGGNKILISSESGESFLLDFGLNFKRWSFYFEEYLKPRSGKILQDLLKLDLIPKMDIYRTDLLPPRFESKEKIKFTFLSHAHSDHSGFVGLIHEHIPLVMTSETFALLNVADQLRSFVWEQLAIKTRAPSNDEHIREDVLIPDKKKKKRKICLQNSVSFSEENFDFIESSQCWPWFMMVLPVYHSVLGAAALCVEVDDILLIYTGDLRASPAREEKEFWIEKLGERRLALSQRTEKFVEEVRRLRSLKSKPMVLIVEGTRVNRENDSVNDERTVYENTLEVTSKARKLVIADFPTKHLERLMTFLKVAQECDRVLVLPPKDFAYLRLMGEIESTWKLSSEELQGVRVYHVAKVEFSKLEKDAILFARANDLLVGPKELNRDPQKYVLAAGYFDMSQILDVDEKALNGSIYIHSTSEAYTEEQQMDYKRLRNWFAKFGIKPFGLILNDEELVFTKEFHASGHLSAKDLENLIDSLNPDIILPVHTEDKNWFIERWGDKVRVQEDVYL
ncbi:ribonuclease J [Pseudothermotoga sp.]|uniref:ribonuclease J n=1 Tax=Pseudothermotoga sp. TaxID=2033661 RepID=UPI0031F6027E